ncbi:alpha-tocopherol transfer protein-like [Glandiceps talaboti]
MASTGNRYVCTLSKYLQEKAARELNEHPETRATCIDSLRERTKSRPDIKFCTDDAFLLRFLRVRKFKIDKAFDSLVRYYEIRREYPQVFDDLRPSSITAALNQDMQCLLTARDDKGAFIIINRIGKWEPSKCIYADVARLTFLGAEKLLENEELQICGVSTILDFADMAPKHRAYLVPGHAKMMMNIIQNVVPIRYKNMHYINTPFLFETGFKLWRMFMKEKMKQRTHIHGKNISQLYRCIPLEGLPQEYGGPLPPLNVHCQNYSQDLLSWEDGYVNKYAGYGYIGSNKDASKTCIDSNGEGVDNIFQEVDMHA